MITWYNNSEGRYGYTGAIGDHGENIVMSLLSNKNIKAVNPQDINSQVHDGVDIIINNNIKANVKTNVFIPEKDKCLHFVEVKNSSGKPGWIVNSKSADIIFAVCKNKKNIAWHYNVNDMKNYVNNLRCYKEPKLTSNGASGFWVNLLELDFVEELDDSLANNTVFN